MARSIVKFNAGMHLDAGAIARARKLLRGAPAKIHQHRVSVGLHEDDASAQAIKVASQSPNTNRPKKAYSGADAQVRLIQVALWHEFGTDRMPERSWLRSWFDTQLEAHKQEMLAAMRAEYQGDAEAVARLAEKWRQDIFSRVADGSAGFKPLSETTRKARAAAGLPVDPPLYATHQLADSFHALVDGRKVA